MRLADGGAGAYLKRLPAMVDPIILSFDLAWMIPLLLIPDTSFQIIGRRYTVLLGIKLVWVGMALVATAAKVVRMRSRSPLVRSFCAWVSAFFWTFVTVILFSLEPVSPWWTLAFVVCMLCWNSAIRSGLRVGLPRPSGSTLSTEGGAGRGA